jgi:hypothetical protein
MKPELYFDINSEAGAGSLFRITKPDGSHVFEYNYGAYDAETDNTKVSETAYENFDTFWQELTKNKLWFYLHPLYVHPEQRPFIQEQLKSVNWKVQGDSKWQQSHQRQWTKVLSDSANYYTPPPLK